LFIFYFHSADGTCIDCETDYTWIVVVLVGVGAFSGLTLVCYLNIRRRRRKGGL